jgi:hypothetical protein
MDKNVSYFKKRIQIFKPNFKWNIKNYYSFDYLKQSIFNIAITRGVEKICKLLFNISVKQIEIGIKRFEAIL